MNWSSILKSLFAPVAFMLLAGCNKSKVDNPVPKVAAQSSKSLRQVKPAPELGEVFHAGEYVIQMPIGYSLQSQRQRGGDFTTSWHAPVGQPPAGDRLFGLMIIDVPEGKSAPSGS